VRVTTTSPKSQRITCSKLLCDNQHFYAHQSGQHTVEPFHEGTHRVLRPMGSEDAGSKEFYLPRTSRRMRKSILAGGSLAPRPRRALFATNIGLFSLDLAILGKKQWSILQTTCASAALHTHGLCGRSEIEESALRILDLCRPSLDDAIQGNTASTVASMSAIEIVKTERRARCRPCPHTSTHLAADSMLPRNSATNIAINRSQHTTSSVTECS
jgi:hypothetical protein